MAVALFSMMLNFDKGRVSDLTARIFDLDQRITQLTELASNSVMNTQQQFTNQGGSPSGNGNQIFEMQQKQVELACKSLEQRKTTLEGQLKMAQSRIEADEKGLDQAIKQGVCRFTLA